MELHPGMESIAFEAMGPVCRESLLFHTDVIPKDYASYSEMKNCNFSKTNVWSLPMAIVFIVVISFFISFQTAQAIGVGVTPARIELTADKQESITSSLTVFNTSDTTAIITLEADEFRDRITLEPHLVELAPQKHREVKVVVKPKKSTVLSTHLSVRAEAKDANQYEPSSGIKVPLVVHANPEARKQAIFTLFGIFMIGLLLGTLCYHIFVSRNLRKKFSPEHHPLTRREQ